MSAPAETAARTAEAETRITESGSDPTAAFDAPTGTLYLAWVRPGRTSPEVVVARSEDGGRTAIDRIDAVLAVISESLPVRTYSVAGRYVVLY